MGYYQCKGDAQCALAKRCARHCEDDSWSGTCRRFAESAPAQCAMFVDVPTNPEDQRIRIKRDPFR
jgi:hypothetical protein